MIYSITADGLTDWRANRFDVMPKKPTSQLLRAEWSAWVPADPGHYLGRILDLRSALFQLIYMRSVSTADW